MLIIIRVITIHTFYILVQYLYIIIKNTLRYIKYNIRIYLYSAIIHNSVCCTRTRRHTFAGEIKSDWFGKFYSHHYAGVGDGRGQSMNLPLYSLMYICSIHNTFTSYNYTYSFVTTQRPAYNAKRTIKWKIIRPVSARKAPRGWIFRTGPACGWPGLRAARPVAISNSSNYHVHTLCLKIFIVPPDLDDRPLLFY